MKKYLVTVQGQRADGNQELGMFTLSVMDGMVTMAAVRDAIAQWCKKSGAEPDRTIVLCLVELAG